MKLKTTLFIAFFCFTFLGFSQNNNTAAFKKFKSELKQQRSPQQRSSQQRNYGDFFLKRILAFVENNEIYSSELIDVCSYVQQEKSKYKICVRAFPNVIDKRNFFDVYDVFNSFSYAIRLYHRTQGGNNVNTNTPPISTVSAINYPDYYNYNGVINNQCNQPLRENQFQNIIQRIKRDRNINFLKVKQIFDSNCLSTSQIMRLSEAVNLKSNHFDFFSYAFDSAYDIENYYHTIQLVDNPAEKTRLKSFIHESIDQIKNGFALNECRPITEDEFRYIITTIKSQSFSQKKLAIAKQHIERNCFSIQQIEKIASVFYYDKDRFEIIKHSYTHVDRTDAFYKLRKLFSYDSTKRKFDQFLLDQKL